MREGLLPVQAKYQFRFIIPHDLVDVLSEQLYQLLDAEETAISLFETEPQAGISPNWTVEIFTTDKVNLSGIHRELEQILANLLPDNPVLIELSELETQSLSQYQSQSLPTLTLPFAQITTEKELALANRRNLQIPAALAFGTGHHPTTRMCLRAIADRHRTLTPINTLDIGTGTGLLAFYTAHLFKTSVLGVDNDPQAIITAKENANNNGFSANPTFLCTQSLQEAGIQNSAPFDFIIANILADPLRAMAKDIAKLADTNTQIILSGLLVEQENYVLQKYRNFGFKLSYRYREDGWSCLRLKN